MADAEKPEGESEEAPTERKKKPRPLIIGIFLLVAGLGIGFGIFLWLGKSDKPAAEANATAEHGADAHAPAESEAVIAEIGQFIVNLRPNEDGEGGGGYLKCKVAVEAGSSVHDRITKKNVQVRNAVLLYLSNLTSADISGSENMRKIEVGLAEQLNTVLGKDAVPKVYLTEFVVQ